MIVRGTRGLILFAAVPLLAAGVGSAEPLDEIQSCLTANLPRSSSEMA